MWPPSGIRFRSPSPASISACDMYEWYVRMANASSSSSSSSSWQSFSVWRGCSAVDTTLVCFLAPLSLMRCDSDSDADVDLDAGISRCRCQLLLCSTRFHHEFHPFPSRMQRHARPYTIISNSRITRSRLRATIATPAPTESFLWRVMSHASNECFILRAFHVHSNSEGWGLGAAGSLGVGDKVEEV